MPEIRKDRLKLRSGEEKSQTPTLCHLLHRVGIFSETLDQEYASPQMHRQFSLRQLAQKTNRPRPGTMDRLLFQQNYQLHQRKFATLAYASQL
jgi:hypothetical protein